MAIVDQETTLFRGDFLRLYVHDTNLKDTFESAFEALNYGLSCISKNQSILRPAQWIIAFIYGWPDERAPPEKRLRENQMAKMMDVFGFHGLLRTDGIEWKRNPTIKSWVFKNGIHVPEQNIACGIEAIVLGREEETRLLTMDINDYKQRKVDLPYAVFIPPHSL
ncbi:MAG TPA: hypothetical protein VJJ75_03465 [Candidatus Nanoarchaeia archaeon]|nr:hypothetical protein [Candidatus Nanoarchaeia archaeon]